ncbi:DUF3373 domain-containing protein [Dissulfurirhabdus thermomarina]|uniref:DUF3373 domain-containing protein n=1 Tax=Dissulfurirhabdus thermomarina TaxID=1765737 RepID=A0A6N9TSQ6_DISTH|nr:DUF3373 family protein [Dissulfurirhabdus thermomarina]NDY42774.1 DUF3373 domain-containing protein [Dissulfurirhabdus thermomarina]NMX22630.1 DUF3373 domain-containing protein [Dissulfurirhabdus thermomarina]
MKRVLTALMVLSLTAWSGSALAARDDQVTLSAKKLKAVLGKVLELQRRVSDLEHGKARGGPSEVEKSAAIPEYDKLTRDIEEIYDTLDKVETRALQDKVNFGVEVRSRVDFFKYEDVWTYTEPAANPNALFGLDPGDMVDHVYPNTINSARKEWTADNKWSTRVRLNMEARAANSLTFHGRLAVYKNWAESGDIQRNVDFYRAHRPDDTTVKLDRAYVDWIVPVPFPLAVTFGRHPSTEGPPMEYRENLPRQATYPSLVYEGETDGIVVTLGLERYTGLVNSGLRLAYGKGYQQDESGYSNFTAFGSRASGIKDTNFWAAFFETEVPYVPESLLVLSYIHGNDLIDNPAGPQANLGNMDVYGAHLQMSNFLDTGLDLFVSWGLNNADPKKRAGQYATTQMYFINPATGLLTTMPVGLLGTQGSKWGWAIYTGFRYTVPVDALKRPKIGFEFNYGSPHWFSFTWGSSDPYNKLATRGKAYEVYYIQPFNRYLFIRTGYTKINYNWSFSGYHLGEPWKIDENLSNFYALLDVRF